MDRAIWLRSVAIVAAALAVGTASRRANAQPQMQNWYCDFSYNMPSCQPGGDFNGCKVQCGPSGCVCTQWEAAEE
jgi:hypothetical protein